MGNIKIKSYANKSLDIVQSVSVDSDANLKPGEVENELNKYFKLYNTFAGNFRSGAELNYFIDRHLDKLNRKLFLASIKAGQTYITETQDGDDIEKPLTDSKTAAMFWVCNAIYSEIYVMHKLPPKEAAEVKAHLIPAISAKVDEIARKRNRQKNNDNQALMYANKLNMIISSLTPKDYTQDGDNFKSLKCAGEILSTSTELAEIRAEIAKDKIEKFDANTSMVYMILQNALANNMLDGTKTEDEKRTVTIALKEYMSKRGLSDPKSARATLETASTALVSFKAVAKTTAGDNFKINGLNITNNAKFENGYFSMTFTKEFVSYIKQGRALELPDNFYKINLRKNANSFYIAKKLVYHAGINTKKTQKEQRANPCLLSVENLLKECRTLPKYDDIKGTGHIYDRIISPFISSLQAIEATQGNPDGFIKYHFTHEKCESLTPGERDDLENGRIKYDDFIKLYVYFEIIDSERAKEIEI